MAPQAKKIAASQERAEVGRHGESLAADFLEKQGFTIIERNWRCRMGEIDLIVAREGEVRFIEVKTRRGTMFGFPEESVGRTKRQRWFRAIEFWLQSEGGMVRKYQADVVSILWRDREPEIVWIQNIGDF